MNKSSSSNGQAFRQPGLLILLAVLALTLGVLFSRGFVRNQVLFSNDGPLGIISSKSAVTTPGSFVSSWQDLNWLGNEGITPAASLSAVLALVLQPLGYAKFAAPIGLLVLGMCAWIFFRQLRLAPLACVIGAVATTLNSDFFSTSCWGIVPQPICIGANFLALAAIARVAEGSAARSWARVVLAGFAVGMGVVEGADVGALFSLFVAAYVLYQTLFLDGGSSDAGRKIGFGVLRVGLVAVFAAIIATHTLSTLVGSQIQGIAGQEQDERTRQAQWNFATEWSLPKAEILQAAVPGVFGYRQKWHMYDDEQPTYNQYWGSIGEGTGLSRLSGTGLYAGVFVLAVAVWTILQSFRGRGSPFTLLQRRAIWFWTLMLVATALLGFGRYAPFYKFFYALPYAPTIRNPTKFMHIFSWALVIVFAYGIHGLATAYMQNPVVRARSGLAYLKDWWSKAAAFDRRWVTGSVVVLAVALVARLIYAAASQRLQDYLPTVDIPASEAADVVRFSLHAVDWFILFLILSIGLMVLTFSGLFSGRRTMLGGALIVLLIVVDLGRADAPWIVYWNTDNKYSSDPVTKFLANKPYEHRVTFFGIADKNLQDYVMKVDPEYPLMQSAYYSQWKQHIWPYNNIECAESIQESRVALDKEKFEAVVAPDLLKNWELLNVRYILAPGDKLIAELFNRLDPAQKLFQTAMFPDGSPVRFNFVPKSEFVKQSSQPVDYNVVPDPNGQLQVLEFTGALPRASLFSNWRVDEDGDSTLQFMSSTNFDPHQVVMVSNAIAPPSPANAGQPAGTVEINDNYEPRRVELSADVKLPSVLLLCDRYNPKWKVSVDGSPAELLRCNFVERGVMLTPGKHTVVFQFTGSVATLAISLTAVMTALALCGWLAFTEESSANNAGNSPAPGPDDSQPPGRPASTNPPPSKGGSDNQKNKSKKG